MLSLEEIKKQYSKNQKVSNDLGNQQFSEKAILREYLQYLMLSIIFSHPIGQKLSFLGGTALRIVYGLTRFSEDIDFDNKNLTYTEFNTLAKHIQKELEREGFCVEIKLVSKLALHCIIKFANILYDNQFTSHENEKLRITVDTFDQQVNYDVETFILNKFEVFQRIIVTPKSVILAQKLWTVTQRKRLKGRDFYDIMFLLQTTKPDKTFLKAKFGIDNVERIKKEILSLLKSADLTHLANDVSSFLINPGDAERIKLFPELLAQTNLD